MKHDDQEGSVSTSGEGSKGTYEAGKSREPIKSVPLATPVAPKPVVEEQSLIKVNIGPLKDITKDTHTRMVQYLGIVNPGVLRVMADMLTEQEKKVVNFLAGAGIKLG
jgi:hypothetical protein